CEAETACRDTPATEFQGCEREAGRGRPGQDAAEAVDEQAGAQGHEQPDPGTKKAEKDKADTEVTAGLGSNGRQDPGQAGVGEGVKGARGVIGDVREGNADERQGGDAEHQPEDSSLAHGPQPRAILSPRARFALTEADL